MEETHEHHDFITGFMENWEKKTKKWIRWGSGIAIISIFGAGLISWGVGMERNNEAEKNIKELKYEKVDRIEMDLKLQNIKEDVAGKFNQLNTNMGIMMQFFGIKPDTIKHKN